MNCHTEDYYCQEEQEGGAKGEAAHGGRRRGEGRVREGREGGSYILG